MGTRAKNLKKARKVRAQIASQFDDLKNDRIKLTDVLEDSSNTFLSRVDVWDVLRRAPHLGPKGAKRVLVKAKVWPHTKVGALTRDERNAILQWLPPRAR